MRRVQDLVRYARVPVARAPGERHVSLSGSGSSGHGLGFEGPKNPRHDPGPKPRDIRPVQEHIPSVPPTPRPKPGRNPGPKNPRRDAPRMGDRISTQALPRPHEPPPPSVPEVISPTVGISPPLIVENAIRWLGWTINLTGHGDPANAPGTPGPDFGADQFAAQRAADALVEMATVLHYQRQTLEAGGQIYRPSDLTVVVTPPDVVTAVPPWWLQGRTEIDEIPEIGDPAIQSPSVNDRAVGAGQPIFGDPERDPFEGDTEWDDAYGYPRTPTRRDWREGLGFEDNRNPSGLTSPRPEPIPGPRPNPGPVVPAEPSVVVPEPEPGGDPDGHGIPGPGPSPGPRPQPGDPLVDMRQWQITIINQRNGQVGVRMTNRPARPGRPQRDRGRAKERNVRAVARLLHVVNRVWGTVSETWDFYDAISWAVYVQMPNGDVHLALTEMSHQEMLRALAEGDPRVRLDLVGAVENVVLMELQDQVIGRTSSFMAERSAQVFDNVLGYGTYDFTGNLQRFESLPSVEEGAINGFLSSLPGASFVHSASVYHAQTRSERVSALFAS